MKKAFMAACLSMLLAAAPAAAQMMDPAGHMARQQEAMMQKAAPQQFPPSQLNPCMMGSCNTAPHMMAPYGYIPGPARMMPYAYLQVPLMMGGYGYGMPQQMVGGRGHHPMHHMMGRWQLPPCTESPGSVKTSDEYARFLDETREERKRLHGLMFDYGEALRSPEPDREKLQAMEREIFELRGKIFTFKAQ